MEGSDDGVGLRAQVTSNELREHDALVDEIDDLLRGSSGQKDFGDARLLEGGDVGFGDDTADEDSDVVHALFAEQVHELRADGVVSARKNGEANDVDVLLDRG